MVHKEMISRGLSHITDMTQRKENTVARR